MTISYNDIRKKSYNRSFDPIAHRESDARGKLAVIEILQSLGRKVLVNTEESIKNGKCDDYHDIKYEKDGVIYKADAEVRKGHWRNGRRHIGYNEISQPARKFRESYDGVDYLFSLSDDLTGAYVFDKKKIQEVIMRIENGETDSESEGVEIVEKIIDGKDTEPFIHISKKCQGDLFHYIVKQDDGKWKIQPN